MMSVNPTRSADSFLSVGLIHMAAIDSLTYAPLRIPCFAQGSRSPVRIPGSMAEIHPRRQKTES